ncbi:MAG: thiol:disulfide oxidoreductase [Gammaproteobacteria bacterium]|nr:MAG: thiol:disulfide oxidoreductase [Gammaproteobacteria bacterium]
MDEEEFKGIDLYTWATPNGRKVSIMWRSWNYLIGFFPIDITKGDQMDPEFIAFSPNNKIPEIYRSRNRYQDDGVRRILMYLAKKTRQTHSPLGDKFWKQMEWLMFQMGHIGPMLGQTHHFVKFNPGKAPYAEERYSKENARLYQVLENRLQERDYIVDDYSIVDIATWPGYPVTNFKRWI